MMGILNNLKFKVYDKKTKKLHTNICGIGMKEDTGEIILVDLGCDSNVGEWTQLADDRYELRVYFKGKRLK